MSANPSSRHISPDALDFALATVLADSGDTDVLPQAHEYEALRDHWHPVRDFLGSKDVRQWQARPLRRCLAPKGDSGFRLVTQLDPLDHLIYTAAVFEVGGSLEAKRDSPENRRVFSWRFSPDEENYRFFDQDTGHREFLSECLEQATNAKFVLEVDIADFYPRIYLHRVENMLDSAVGGPKSVLIKSLLKQWSQNVSYGIPIGQHASRLLADTVIHDVDAALIAEGARYCRFADDYRFFCASKRECNFWVLRIAELLDRLHGLTIQPSKTHIQTADDFLGSLHFFLDSSEQAEMNARITQLLGDIEWEYGTIDFDDLDPADQALILDLDLPSALEERFQEEYPNYRHLQSILLWLGRTSDNRALESVLRFDRTEQLRPTVAALARYISSLTLSESDRSSVAMWLGHVLSDSSLGDSEYGRAWLLWMASQQDLLADQQWIELYRRYTDEFTRPAAAAALGRVGADYWVREQKTQAGAMSAWLRRALLSSGTALPADERRHWFQSLRPGFDVLESAVADHAQGKKATPFTLGAS